MTNKMTAELIAVTPNSLDVAYTAMKTCYSSFTPSENWSKRNESTKEDKLALVDKVLSSNHYSTIEHIYLTFSLNGLDRNISHQLVRHRLASYSQQSLRYVDISKKCNLEDLYSIVDKYDVEKAIEVASEFYTNVDDKNCMFYIKSLIQYREAVNNGAKKEEARNLLCSNVRTNIVMSLNLRSFIHLCELRLCSRTQKPTRKLVQLMVNAIKEYDDSLDWAYKYFTPKCEQLEYCLEHKSCGRKPTLKDLGVNK